MKISYQWLKEFVEFDATPAQLADALTNSGTVVETIENVAGDAILDLDLTSNRPDCLSHWGVAREVATLYGKPRTMVSPVVAESATPASQQVTVEIPAPALCGRYCARVIRNVNVAPSPDWLARRLEAVGVRPINNVADATNYVLMELGHPMHAFDLAKVSGRKIIVREAAAGEKLFTLDGLERELEAGMLVIADAQKAVALAGIMGGLESEISFSTRDVLLESAWFDPVSIRKTSKKLGMHTEASHRFERGADINAATLAIDRVAELILQLAGGELLQGIVDCHPRPLRREPIWLRKSRIVQMMGMAIEEKTVEHILIPLGFEILRRDDAGWEVALPSSRLDVEREIDLVEEIARHYGYDKFPSALPAWTGWGCRRPEYGKQKALKDRLSGLGYSETLTYSFIDANENQRYSLWPAVPLANPLSAEMGVMRTSLLPGLLQSLLRNYNRGMKSLRLYELGRIYGWQGEGKPHEEPHLGLIATGNFQEKEPFQEQRPLGFFDLKGDIAALLEVLGLPVGKLAWKSPRAESVSGFKTEVIHPAVSAEIWLEGQCLGLIGQLHPRLCDMYKVKQAVFVALLPLAPLCEFERPEKKFRAIPRFPSIQRDLALVVDRDLPYSQIEEVIRSARIEAVQKVQPFDLYVGEKLPPGKKGVAISISYQAFDRTLQEEEIGACQEQIIALLESRVGAQLRK